MSEITLSEARFRRTGNAEVGDLDVKIQLGTIRPSAEVLGVQLIIEANPEESFELVIGYRCVFSRSTPFSDGEDAEGFWRTVVAGVGPAVLVPYIRAEFSHLLNAGGIHGKVFPLMNPSTMFSPDEIQIPPPSPAADQGPST